MAKKHVGRSLVGLMLALNIFSAVQAQDALTTDELIHRVQFAMSTADVTELAALYNRAGNLQAHVLAAMALERVHGNFQKSNDDAKVCVGALMQSEPDVAIFCNEVLVGNLRLAGNPDESVEAEREMLKAFTGHMDAAKLSLLTSQAQTAFARPVARVVLPAGSFDIPFVSYDDSHRDVPAIKLTAHGHTVIVKADTGGNDLLLDEETAKQMGVRLTGSEGHEDGFFSGNVITQSGVLDHASFSGMDVTDIPVEVTPDKNRVIGLNILRQLRIFTLSKAGVHVFAPTDTLPTCSSPLLWASNLWGWSTKIAIPLKINGNYFPVVMDSGSGFYLSANSGRLPGLVAGSSSRLKVKDIGHDSRDVTVTHKVSEVVFGDSSIQVSVDVFDNLQVPFFYLLGNPVLNDFDFYVNFDSNVACLVRHG